VRYLSLAEALLVAEAVTGLEPMTLARSSRLDLLDSAQHAPQIVRCPGLTRRTRPLLDEGGEDRVHFLS